MSFWLWRGRNAGHVDGGEDVGIAAPAIPTYPGNDSVSNDDYPNGLERPRIAIKDRPGGSLG
jgi:hypothetical protein